jgi:hypothetical protein
MNGNGDWRLEIGDWKTHERIILKGNDEYMFYSMIISRYVKTYQDNCIEID